MREQKKVIIDIDPDGNCSIGGEGFVGPECGHFLSEIEESLGTQISQKDKPEYRQRHTTSNRNRQCEGR
ncbi:hypothetical protein LCGC14_0221130 [marine sediment metagenome]|uniref:DUF2997 domain-containing protein n=1 Tax=marine sediment metagenome TaxID=412755 RepID=A0A0F9UDH5_9ZZZZ